MDVIAADDQRLHGCQSKDRAMNDPSGSKLSVVSEAQHSEAPSSAFESTEVPLKVHEVRCER